MPRRQYTLLFRFLTYVLFIAGFTQPLRAQERNCHSLQHAAYLKERGLFSPAISSVGSARASLDSVLTIPVVVHVVWKRAEENISDEQIISQIDVLNEDYAALNSSSTSVPGPWQSLITDASVRFCLARRDPSGQASSGIVRVETVVDEFQILDTAIKNSLAGGSDAWPADSYLNIWVCNLENNALGYSSFPGTAPSQDGLVIAYPYFGREGNVKSPYNKGRTCTHEAGHWLSLLHIWGDEGNCGNDDGISDTPLQGGPTYRCPTFPKTDGCTQTAPGIMYMNYMDYTDDACMMFFTPEQISAMHQSIQQWRLPVYQSPALQYPAWSGVELELDSILSPVRSTVSQCLIPELRIANRGSLPVTSFTIRYRMGDGPVYSFVWSGQLDPLQKTTVALPETGSPASEAVFKAWLEHDDDQLSTNNYKTASFSPDPSAYTRNCPSGSAWVYPNPLYSGTEFCLQPALSSSGDTRIALYNSLGQQVYFFEQYMNPGDRLRIPVTGQNAGVFIVRIESNEKEESVRLVVMPKSSTPVPVNCY